MDLCIEPGQSLGLMIRGGLEYNLGIYITGVDKDSVADRAGLMVSRYINIGTYVNFFEEQCRKMMCSANLVLLSGLLNSKLLLLVITSMKAFVGFSFYLCKK